MKNFNYIFTVIFVLIGINNANGFTLANGTNQTVVNNLGEEYRWNTPLLTYAYDESFLNYFGKDGVDAIEEAIKMLNTIPPVSTIKTNYPPTNRQETNIWNFPTRPDRYHARADSLGLLDMKSYALRELFGYLGLGDAVNNAFQIDTRSLPLPPFIPAAVTLRNYDPISRLPSKYVNGSLLSFVVLGGTNALTFPVDVMRPARTLASEGLKRFHQIGKFLIGPTRDDIGGLMELYRKDNFNVEPMSPNTFQIITNQPNLTNPAVYSIDLRWFSKESKTNSPFAFKQFVTTNQWWGNNYTNLNIPPLVVLKTNVNWKMSWTTNVTPYLTNFPWTPVGQPPTLVYLTNKLRVFKPSYDYIFANVITNLHVPVKDSKVLYRSWEVIPKAPLWSVVGSVPTTTNYTTTIINDDNPHGEIIILPTTNVVGYHFNDMKFQKINTLTNILTDTNSLANPGDPTGQGQGLGAGGAAITNFVGLMEDEVWQSTNHAYLAFPIVYATNNLLMGGVDKIRYKHFQSDSWVTTNYNFSNNKYIKDFKFPNLEKQTFNYIFPGLGGVAGNIGSAAITNGAAMPSFTYNIDYIDINEGIKKTGTFVKFFSGPDIIFSAANMPYWIGSQSSAPLAVNNRPINGFNNVTSFVNPDVNPPQEGIGISGPGNLRVPPVGFPIRFNKIGTFWNPSVWLPPNVDDGNRPLDTAFLNEENSTPGWNWGYFNGSTKNPIIFPSERSIEEIEELIFNP